MFGSNKEIIYFVWIVNHLQYTPVHNLLGLVIRTYYDDVYYWTDRENLQIVMEIYLQLSEFNGA